MQKLAFYVSEKDISLLSPCNTQNYTLALQKLDGYVLPLEASFNANRELSKIKGYCTGKGETNFLFYGGVCGMTAQLFRTTLIHPSIEIVKRRPHNERFVQYYGEEIGGDDAAIYEMSKQFEIKNIGNDDIYFKVKRNAEHTLLVAISPRIPQRVEINKQPPKERSITMERKIWENSIVDTDVLVPALGFSLKETGEKADHLIKQDIFFSVYVKKNYEMR
ncbi:MAG: VanW family protein [Candidatus Peribacteria bacterium]|nr:VanW family protein [Candidatus Peribacteria bacterium]